MLGGKRPEGLCQGYWREVLARRAQLGVQPRLEAQLQDQRRLGGDHACFKVA